MSKIYDTIVIGAGLSGLTSALTLQSSSLTPLVLEARSRVGGKTWSVPLASGKGFVDIGAAWCNDTNQTHITALVKKFGLELVKQNIDGECRFQDEDGKIGSFWYGSSPPWSEEEVGNLEGVRDMIHDLSVGDPQAAVKLDGMSLEEFVKKQGAGEKTIKMIRIWSRVMLGVEADHMSARFFVEYCAKGGGLKTLRSDEKGGGQALRFRKGTQSIAKGIAGLLKEGSIKLSTPVVEIADSEDGVVVTAKNGTKYKGKKCIISIPTPLYKDIKFSPPLSGKKLDFSSGTEHGYYSKMILCYNSPWWIQYNSCGLSLSYLSPVGVVRDTSVAADGQYSLTCFIGGAPGRAWSELPSHERRAQVLQQISNIYGRAKEAFEPIEIFEQEWTKEEWSKGAPCPVTGLGLLDRAGEGLREVVGNLHFVGTETSDVWAGYMEGAVRSGIRGADEVIESLGARRIVSKL